MKRVGSAFVMALLCVSGWSAPSDLEQFSGSYSCVASRPGKYPRRATVQLDGVNASLSLTQHFSFASVPTLVTGETTRRLVSGKDTINIEYLMKDFGSRWFQEPVHFEVNLNTVRQTLHFTLRIPGVDELFVCTPEHGNVFAWRDLLEEAKPVALDAAKGTLLLAVKAATVAGVVRSARPIRARRTPFLRINPDEYFYFDVELEDQFIGRKRRSSHYFVYLDKHTGVNARPKLKGKIVFLWRWREVLPLELGIDDSEPIMAYSLEPGWYVSSSLRPEIDEYLNVINDPKGQMEWAEKYRDSPNSYLKRSALAVLSTQTESRIDRLAKLLLRDEAERKEAERKAEVGRRAQLEKQRRLLLQEERSRRKQVAERETARREELERQNHERRLREKVLTDNRKASLRALSANSLTVVRNAIGTESAVILHIRFLAKLKTDEAFMLLKEVALDTQRPDPVRFEAMKALSSMPDGDAIIATWKNEDGVADEKLCRWAKRGRME